MISVVKEFDPTDMVFGVLDPAIAYTLGAMAMGAAGAALGIFAGSAAWGIVRSSAQAGMKAREKEFFARIKANRVIPSSQAVSNASPDFYGEKITSLRGYRKWLKSQNKVGHGCRCASRLSPRCSSSSSRCPTVQGKGSVRSFQREVTEICQSLGLILRFRHDYTINFKTFLSPLVTIQTSVPQNAHIIQTGTSHDSTLSVRDETRRPKSEELKYPSTATNEKTHIRNLHVLLDLLPICPPLQKLVNILNPHLTLVALCIMNHFLQIRRCFHNIQVPYFLEHGKHLGHFGVAEANCPVVIFGQVANDTKSSDGADLLFFQVFGDDSVEADPDFLEENVQNVLVRCPPNHPGVGVQDGHNFLASLGRCQVQGDVWRRAKVLGNHLLRLENVLDVLHQNLDRAIHARGDLVVQHVLKLFLFDDNV